MPLLLLSLGAGALPEFLSAHLDRAVSGARIGYLGDAAGSGEDGFASVERQRLTELGCAVVDVSAGSFVDAESFAAALDGVDAVYVAGGNTFLLLDALRRHGAAEVLAARVRAGLPYIGLSAGSIVVGPSVEPAVPMDDRSAAPGLTDLRGLGLVDTVVIPHADGRLESYPPALIAGIVAEYADRFPLALLPDDQAFAVEQGELRPIPSP
ncbi:Type 1 glutamine amidotransferase-like domain-containing protein [Microbacterium sp.]|uniref:Type 1 glutamine amidotransferase-like domain-containing protein n=1 Tax=Microbacterium sp. TaxID=51671 RepID=UPI0033423392